ncbi:SDR family oxidoreductase [Actinokineospora sp. HUAS TT18]|uniref:SDR family oxidoreductase n=1 Tax=Actinokineospora sp. HUAS TT18 TaxID=3447451 RepID=UPI003F5279A5
MIGADRVPPAWLRSKLDAGRAVAESGVPWTTLRAAQFHSLTLTMVEKMAKLLVVPVPGGLRLPPVDTADVATRLVGLSPPAWCQTWPTPPCTWRRTCGTDTKEPRRTSATGLLG